MVSGISDHKELADIAQKLGELTQLLDEKQLRWLELSEMAG
jgi:ABC transport system ATP-binding/permease protein